MVTVGESAQFTAVAEFSDGRNENVTTVAQWSSSNATIASVSTAGSVSALRVGAIEIRATYQGVNGAFALTITAAVGSRSTVDRPDDFGGAQFKVLYVVPSDRMDRQFDIDGTLRTSVAAFQNWLARESGGQRFRMDTSGGQLDITFVRLGSTDAQIMSAGVFQRDRLERELKDIGFNVPQKIYAVYYEGGHSFSCGDSFAPLEGLPGNVVALYLQGTPPGAPPCHSNPFATNDQAPGYREFSMAHEFFHGMGFVAPCAPRYTRQGHVDDDPTDLMYAGQLPWAPSKLDVNRDDYYKHGRACPDAAQSPYLTGG